MWVTEYLKQMLLASGSLPKQFIERRVLEFQSLVEKGDWELQTYRPSTPISAVEGDPPQAVHP